MLFAKVNGGAQLHVRTTFSYLANGWTDFAETWYVVRDPLGKRFTKVDVRYVRLRTCSCTQRVRLHVCMCASLLRISGTAGRTALKFGVWLGDQWLCLLHRVGNSALTQM